MCAATDRRKEAGQFGKIGAKVYGWLKKVIWRKRIGKRKIRIRENKKCAEFHKLPTPKRSATPERPEQQEKAARLLAKKGVRPAI